MGIHERDYYREEPRGIFLGGQQSAVVTLIIVNAAVFLVCWFSAPDGDAAHSPVTDYLALNANVFQEAPWRLLWQPVTHAFLHADIWHLAFNMLLLWVVGRDIEVIYGKKQFYQLYFSLVLLAGMCWVLSENLAFRRFDSSAIGASGAVAGVFMVFVWHYPKRILLLWGVIPVPVWLLGVLWVGNDLMNYAQELKAEVQVQNIAFSAHLGGFLFGYVFYRWRVTLFSFLPGGLGKLSWKRVRGPKLRVHQPPETETDLEEHLDRILEKIHTQGTDSLTKEEQRILEAASHRAKKRRGHELNR